MTSQLCSEVFLKLALNNGFLQTSQDCSQTRKYSRSLTQQHQEAISSWRLHPREVVMEMVPKVLWCLWLSPPNTTFNVPSQQLSKMAVEVTKTVEDWILVIAPPCRLPNSVCMPRIYVWMSPARPSTLVLVGFSDTRLWHLWRPPIVCSKYFVKLIPNLGLKIFKFYGDWTHNDQSCSSGVYSLQVFLLCQNTFNIKYNKFPTKYHFHNYNSRLITWFITWTNTQ